MVSPFRELPVWWGLEQRPVGEGSPPPCRDEEEASGRHNQRWSADDANPVLRSRGHSVTPQGTQDGSG